MGYPPDLGWDTPLPIPGTEYPPTWDGVPPPPLQWWTDIPKYNKKVLLRERKRHTAHRIASAHYAALCNGGTPSQVWGGTPSQVGGYPISGQGGYPISGRGVHPSQVWGVPRVPPPPPGQTWDGVPPRPERWGTPAYHLRTRAVITTPVLIVLFRVSCPRAYFFLSATNKDYKSVSFIQKIPQNYSQNNLETLVKHC